MRHEIARLHIQNGRPGFAGSRKALQPPAQPSALPPTSQPGDRSAFDQPDSIFDVSPTMPFHDWQLHLTEVGFWTVVAGSNPRGRFLDSEAGPTVEVCVKVAVGNFTAPSTPRKSCSGQFRGLIRNRSNDSPQRGGRRVGTT